MSTLRYVGLLIACFVGSLTANLLFNDGSPVQAKSDDAEFGTVEAREFKLIDKSGNKRAHLFGNKEKGASFVLYDEDNRHRIALSTVAGGVPEVSLFDGRGKTRATMSLDSKGWPHLLINDAEENAVWMAPGYHPAQKDDKPVSEKDRWGSLRKGMTQKQVLELLGNPQLSAFSGSQGLIWYWGVSGMSAVKIDADGWIQFDGATVKSWQSPYEGK